MFCKIISEICDRTVIKVILKCSLEENEHEQQPIHAHIESHKTPDFCSVFFTKYAQKFVLNHAKLK